MTTPADSWSERRPFKPRAYTFDTLKAADLPLSTVITTEAGPLEQATTLDALYDRLSTHTLLDVESRRNQTALTTKEGVTLLQGAPFVRELLVALLQLKKLGVDGFSAWWFWYDDDHVDDDPDHQSFSFFVVYRNQIVPDTFHFHRHEESGFDLSIFRPEEPYTHWVNETGSLNASVRYWYRKFYLETLPGQLMVLREGAPLFHCEDARVDQKALQQALLANVQRLRWLAQWLILLLTVIAVGLWVK